MRIVPSLVTAASSLLLQVNVNNVFNSPSFLLLSSIEQQIITTAADSPTSSNNNNKPKDYRELSSKAINDLTNGRFTEAVDEFNEAIDILSANKNLNTDNAADLFLSRGIAFEKLEKWDSAIDDYKRANEVYRKQSFIPRDDPVAISNIANAQTGKLQWKEALDGFTYASQLNSKIIYPAIGKALVLYQLGQRDESMKYFESLVKEYPSYADGLAALAVMKYSAAATTPSSMSGNTGNAAVIVNELWEDALEEDSRYLDIEWVCDIRRWPPALVNDLIAFKKSMSSSNAQ